MRQPPPSFQSRFDRGIDGIKVELWEPMEAQAAANTISSFYLSTWGDPVPIEHWHEEPDEAWKIATDAMEGKVLPNTLESIPVTFSITGISRATTHQLVRSRVGAVFGQQGGRDNNWHNFNQRIPDTWYDHENLVRRIETFHIYQNDLYQAAIQAGVPYQDARYVLPMGLETSLVASYNLLSFKGLAERRLCNRMMWETNYVVRLMSDLVVQAFPFVGRNLRSTCEKRGVCGSVSPMFPPACWTVSPEIGIKLAVDNPTLRQSMANDMSTYDFPATANGCHREFATADQIRLEKEQNDPNTVYSLIHSNGVAWKEEGFWSNG